mgnify:FL=1
MRNRLCETQIRIYRRWNRLELHCANLLLGNGITFIGIKNQSLTKESEFDLNTLTVHPSSKRSLRDACASQYVSISVNDNISILIIWV